MTRTRRSRLVAVVCTAQLVMVGVAVAPRLSARLLGEEYRLAVAPVDPIEPFRGAYVALSYPGLAPGGPEEEFIGASGQVYVPLTPDGDRWRPQRPVSRRPQEPPYLACTSTGYVVSCGIETLFASQERARQLEETLRNDAVAIVRVDRRGNAAVVDVVPARGATSEGGGA